MALRTNAQEAQFPDGVLNGMHTQGLAFDVQFWDPVYTGVWPCDPMDFWKAQSYGGFGVYNAYDPRYAQIGAIGEGLGLTWGGNWSYYDPPHFQR